MAEKATSRSQPPEAPKPPDSTASSRYAMHSPTDPEFNPSPDAIAARLGLLAPDLVQNKK